MEQKKQTKFIMRKREIGKIVLCLIIAIIMLTSLKAIATTIIAGSAEVIEDEKTIVRTAASVSRGASSSNKVEVATLTAELGRYASTTVTQISSEILQVKFNRTGNLYEINVNVGPTFDVTGAIPYLPVGYTPVKNTDLETGFVIEDEDGNQFVWIEVPRTAEVYPTAGTNITSFNDATYNNIEADLRTYTSVYRSNAEGSPADEYYPGHDVGLTETEYNELKKKMLKSIYINGGFYIGRYETGIDYSESPRTENKETTQKPVIKQNKYPYNFVTTAQSQELASSFATTGYKTSLMFGVQWDLVLKYLEISGAATQEELNLDSTSFGNYNQSSFTINNANAKYSFDATTWLTPPYTKEVDEGIILTTGASDTFRKQNIYDLAGNLSENTLERYGNGDYPESSRGGKTFWGNFVLPASFRNGSSGEGWSVHGFRVALYKDETDNTRTPTYIPEGYTHIAGDMDSGYVIADPSGNEYVWVEVPRTAEVYPTAGTNITAFTSTAYDKIEADLHTYTATYRAGTTYSDTWSSEAATGLTENEYNTQKKKMLKSIYKNGGFYVGRYETGIDYSQGPRCTKGDTTQVPVIKQNAYPYHYVTHNQSQNLASTFAHEGYTSSLMFGIQWNLMLKYLENKGTPQDELITDSTNWGNYGDNLYNITNTNAKYIEIPVNLGNAEIDENDWKDGAYGQKNEPKIVVLSTGVSNSFSKQNIYDIAGNLWEYTLEYTGNTTKPCAYRGASAGNDGDVWTSHDATTGTADDAGYSSGFRVALYKDETDTTRTPTYIPEGYTHIAGDMDSGYVIADASGNEFVWVEVPRTSAVYPTAGLSITSFTEDEFDAIEADLHTYTSVYRNGTAYTDTWSSESATGLTSNQYYTQKKKMLKSIYKNGGFYVGRYETGTTTARTAAGELTQTPVIKQNAYPYNFVTNAQAQELASSFETTGYETNLLFGVQWDLTLKYLETKNVTQAELITDSTSWGNYNDNLWNVVNTNAKFYVDGAENWTSGTYKKTENGSILLSTGASETFNKQNIYDLAGNVFECTLEYTSNSSRPVSIRGGHFSGLGNVRMAVNRYNQTTTVTYDTIGFRVALYTDEDVSQKLYNRIYNASNLDGNGTTGVATTTLKDLAGNYDATIYGSPTFGNGYISLNEGSATNQYIDIGPALDVTTITVKLKFSTSSITTTSQFLLGNWETGGFGIGLKPSGNLDFGIYRQGGTDYEYATSTISLETNKIYDVTAIYDGKYIYLYIDGVLQERHETAGGMIKNPVNNENVLIGTNPFKTGIENVLGSKIKVYEASISSAVEHPEGFIRNYSASNLDGNGTTGVSTTTLKDLSGNHDATIYGNPTFGNGYIALNQGSTTGQYIDLGQVKDVSELTVNFKFSVSQLTGNAEYFMGNWENGGFGIGLHANGRLFFSVYPVGETNAKYATATNPITVDTIYDVTGVYDGEYAYLYVNGVLQQKLQTAGGNIKNPDNNVHLVIGADMNGSLVATSAYAKIKFYSASIIP